MLFLYYVDNIFRQNSSKKEVMLEALEDAEADTVAVEAMVVAEEAAVDLEVVLFTFF